MTLTATYTKSQGLSTQSGYQIDNDNKNVIIPFDSLRKFTRHLQYYEYLYKMNGMKDTLIHTYALTLRSYQKNELTMVRYIGNLERINAKLEKNDTILSNQVTKYYLISEKAVEEKNRMKENMDKSIKKANNKGFIKGASYGIGVWLAFEIIKMMIVK